jgi:hypothetical protein
MALDVANLLSQVETAIEQLLTGNVQSYAIGSRNVTKLDLDSLFEQRRILQAELERQSGGGIFSLAKMGRAR